MSLRAGIGIGLHEHFLRAQLGGAVEIDRVDGLVGAEREDAAHALVDGGVDDVLAADDVGLDGFERVVLAGRNLLQGGGVDDDVTPAKARSRRCGSRTSPMK